MLSRTATVSGRVKGFCDMYAKRALCRSCVVLLYSYCENSILNGVE